MGQSYNNLNQINNPPNTTNETTNETINANTTEIINYMWIDKDVNKTFFEFEYFNELFNEKRKCYKFDKVDEGLEKLFSLKYQDITIIISGSFFPEFYEKFDQYINTTKDFKEFPFPTVVIFCREKELFISNLILNNNYDNNYLLNKDLIFNVLDELVKYINGDKEDEDLTFDEVKNLKELIIPCFYSYLIQDVTENEIDYYNNNILTNFEDNDKEKEKQIKGLIINLKKRKIITKELICKNWLRIYTIQSSFFPQMNKALRREDETKFLYHPLIKICHEGVRNKFLYPIFKKKLFRGAVISKKELEKLIKNLENNNKIQKATNQEFPKVIVSCRSFLSFSEREGVAYDFLRFNTTDEKTERIMYEIQEIDNDNIDENTLSNCSVKDFAQDKTEQEVLLFPLSCFEVVEIKEKTQSQPYRIILKYLGRYGNPIREQLGDNFFEYIKLTKFSDDLIKEKITINKDFESSWIIDKLYEKKYKDLSFILDNEKDILINTNNSISIFDLLSYNEKTLFSIKIVDNINIICLIKLKKNGILFSTSNNFIQLIEFFYGNKKYKIKFQVQLQFCAYNLLYLEKEKEKNLKKNNLDKNNENNEENLNVDKIIFTNNNYIYCLFQIKNNLYLEELINEKNKIITIKAISNNKIIYITEDINDNTSVHFLNLNEKEKNNTIKIGKSLNEFKNVVALNDYCLIGFENILYLVDNNKIEIITPFLLDHKLIDLINYKNDEILLGIYNEGKNASFLREIKIEFENDKYIPYMIGEGKIDDEKISKIIGINSNYTLVNTQKETLYKLEKKNKANEIFQESYKKYNKKKLETEKKGFDVINEQNISFMSERNNIYNINNIRQKNFNLKNSFTIDEDFNNYIYSHRESNSNYFNQIENDQQIFNYNITHEQNNINCNNINNIPHAITDKNINQIKPVKIKNFEEKIKEINLKEKEDENKEKSLLFSYPKANTTPLTINYIKSKNIKSKKLIFN